MTHCCMDGKAAAVEAFNFPWSYKNVEGANHEICHLFFATAGGPRSYARLFDDHGPGRDTSAYLMSVCGLASPWSQLTGFRVDMVVSKATAATGKRSASTQVRSVRAQIPRGPCSDERPSLKGFAPFKQHNSTDRRLR